MKKTFLVLLTILVSLSSCEFRLFQFTVTPTLTESSVAEAKNTFELGGEITADDILDLTELDNGVFVTDVQIISIVLNVTPRAGNEADQVSLSANFITSNGTVVPIFSQNPFTADIDNTPGATTSFNDLNSQAVGELRSKINQFLQGGNLQPFGVVIQGSTTDPAKDDLKYDISLVVELAITYEECVEVPLGLGGEECAP